MQVRFVVILQLRGENLNLSAPRLQIKTRLDTRTKKNMFLQLYIKI